MILMADADVALFQNFQLHLDRHFLSWNSQYDVPVEA